MLPATSDSQISLAKQARCRPSSVPRLNGLLRRQTFWKAFSQSQARLAR